MRAFFLTFLCLVCLLPGQLSGQDLIAQDVVYLHDGRVFRGRLIEQVPRSHLRLELLGGSELVFMTSEVARLTREWAPYEKVKRRFNPRRFPLAERNQGWEHQIGLQPRWEWSALDVPGLRVGLHYRLGYRWSCALHTGLGTGIEVYNGGWIAPLTLYLGGDLRPGRFSPFYRAEAGYGLGFGPFWWLDEFQGGFRYQLAGGLKIRTHVRTEWMIGLGWQAQYARQVEWGGFGQNPGRRVTEFPFGAAVLQLGFSL
jgi:hypothetical protein